MFAVSLLSLLRDVRLWFDRFLIRKRSFFDFLNPYLVKNDFCFLLLIDNMSELMLTVNDLEKFYGRKSLFTTDLAMTLLRKLDGKIDLVKHIHQFAICEKKRKYYYDDLLKYSNVIINIGNAIISEELKFECYDSFANFSDNDLHIIGNVLVEVLSHLMNDCYITPCMLDSDKGTFIIRIFFMARVRFFKISFYTGRSSRNPAYVRNTKSNRSVVTTFNVVKKVSI